MASNSPQFSGFTQQILFLTLECPVGVSSFNGLQESCPWLSLWDPLSFYLNKRHLRKGTSILTCFVPEDVCVFLIYIHFRGKQPHGPISLHTISGKHDLSLVHQPHPPHCPYILLHKLQIISEALSARHFTTKSQKRQDHLIYKRM